MLERKTIDIKTNIITTNIAITYILTEDGKAKNLKFWVQENFKDDTTTIYVVDVFGKHLFDYRGKSRTDLIEERAIFREYQALFGNKRWLNYVIKKEMFKTEKLANVMKPYRDFIEIDTKYLDKVIKKTFKEVDDIWTQ